MSKVNQIQNKLRELDGGAFQKLVDAYLHKKGYEQINSIGSVIGADKVRQGTPDTLLSLSDGTYVFVEHTVQQTGVYEKFKSDLVKCFDEEKTGIPVSKIDTVLLCCTAKLSAEQEEDLRELCQSRNVKLSLYGIDTFAFDLYQKYPGIAKELLGIEVDTGQIIPPDEFIRAYNKRPFITPLDTTFQFREEEVGQIMHGLETDDLVIVTGRAGVGKSRLVLECCHRFAKEHPEYEVRCIFNRGADLYEDIRVHFSEPKNFLIFVDDANRVNRFDAILQQIHEKNEERCVKVVATVRDYALNKIREQAYEYGRGLEIEIKPFEEEKIKKLIEEQYGIDHFHFLNRIATVAQGNPRLAIMAAQVISNKKTISSISDVSALYDDYFRSIRQDLEELENPDLLKVAGIISFFRSVNRTHEEMMTEIETAFGLSASTFWDASRRLHNMEIVDIYEDEAVKISDQVLATYLFYLAVFREEVVDCSILFERYFPRFRHRLQDAIIPVINTFNHKHILGALDPHVDRLWEVFERTERRDALFHLMEDYWFIKETEVLLYISDQISEMQQSAIELPSQRIESDSDIPSSSVLRLLRVFSRSNYESYQVALELLFSYFDKRQSEVGKLLYLLTNDYGFDHRSYLQGYKNQKFVVDFLWKRCESGSHLLWSNLFLTVSEHYLRTRFENTESAGRRTYSFIRFQLPATSQIFEIRQVIWNGLFQLFQVPSLREDVLMVIHQYSRNSLFVDEKDIISHDAELLLPFLSDTLDAKNFQHCCLANDLLKLLDLKGASFDKTLLETYANSTHTLYQLFKSYWRDWESDLGYEEQEALWAQRINLYCAGYQFDDYQRVIEHCRIIMEGRGSREEFELQKGITQVFLSASTEDTELFIKVVRYYLKLSDPLHVRNKWSIIRRLIEICGDDKAYEILSEEVSPATFSWLFQFYQLISPEAVTAEHLEVLYFLYEESKPEELPYDFEYLLRFRSVDSQVFVRITNIMMVRAEEEPRCADGILPLFRGHAEGIAVILEQFSSNHGLLKKAYFAALKMDEHIDYQGYVFNQFLHWDSDFITEYLEHMYREQDWLISVQGGRDYSFLWLRDDYRNVFAKVVKYMFEKGSEHGMTSDLDVFFSLRESGSENVQIQERQDGLIKDLIGLSSHDPKFMQFVFNLIADFSPERRCRFVAIFVEHNNEFEHFASLRFEPWSESYWGSYVPVLQAKIEFWEMLLPLFKTVAFLRHKRYVESRIRMLREEMEKEKIRDFMED